MVNVEKAAAAAQGKGKSRESVIEAVLESEMAIAKASKADELVWLDGAAAGSLLGAVVGLLSKCLGLEALSFMSILIESFFLDKFPTPLFVRTLAFGAILGTIEGGLRIAQAKVGSLRGTEEEPEAQSAT